MVGRGTRLCPDLFAPRDHKRNFYLFDYCRNLEYFGQNPATTEGAIVESLGKRLFTDRLSVVGELDKRIDASVKSTASERSVDVYVDPATDAQVRHAAVDLLRHQVEAMKLHNVGARRHCRAV